MRGDIKERRKQITESEEALDTFENEEVAGAFGEKEVSYESFKNPEENQLKGSSGSFGSFASNESKSDFNESAGTSGSQPKAYLGSQTKLPTLNEDNVEEFLELEAKLKRASKEEGRAGSTRSLDLVIGANDRQGDGGAMGARNAILSGSKSSQNLKMRANSLQTPTIPEGKASPPSPERRRTMIPKLTFRKARPPSIESNP